MFLVAGFISIPDSLGVGHRGTWMRQEVGQLAFIRRDAEGTEVLFAGALPP